MRVLRLSLGLCRAVAVAVVAVLLALGGQLHAQEHAGYARADIEYGLTVYRAQCAPCHGATGDAVPGVDLRSGNIRRASDDRMLRNLIMSGIPGVGMPPGDLDAAELTGVVAYLRNMNFEADELSLGDAERGRIVFEGKGDCQRCHRVNGRGPRTAPELTAIGSMRPPGLLRRALLDPTGSMRPINRPVQLVTADGERVTGRRLNEDTYTVQLIDDNERLRSFDRASLREFTVLTESPMPSYEGRLSEQELADLLAYLVSLKG